MYHSIVRAIITNIFVELNKGNYEPVLNTMGKDFEHWFSGHHALSGRRTTMPATRAWYERLYKIFPKLHFDLHKVVVSGWPWNTLVAVEWSEPYTLLNGVQGANCGTHFIRLKWGKGVSVRIYCDTHLLLENLSIQHAGGVAEAACEPIVG